MHQEIIEIYPFYKDSWEIISEKIAEKHTDKSIFKYGQTRIPKEIVSFFHAENLKAGGNKTIKIFHSNKIFIGEITMGITGRMKLSLGKELQGVINTKLDFCSKYFLENDCETDEIEDRPYIIFNMLSDNMYKMELLIE